MADSILFVGWNRPVVGREPQARALFEKGMDFYTKLQADGRIESFEPVLLEAHGGDLNGFIMLKGDAEKLDAVRRDDAYLDLSIEAQYCLEGFGVVRGFIGEGIADFLSRWHKQFEG